MSEPLYGFRTKVTFEKSCGTFGLACQDKNEFESRQTNEEFRSDAPPDCRLVNQCNT